MRPSILLLVSLVFAPAIAETALEPPDLCDPHNQGVHTGMPQLGWSWSHPEYENPGVFEIKARIPPGEWVSLGWVWGTERSFVLGEELQVAAGYPVEVRVRAVRSPLPPSPWAPVRVDCWPVIWTIDRTSADGALILVNWSY